MRIPLRKYFRLLLKYLRPLWRMVLLLSCVLALNIALDLLGPQVLARFIDGTQAGHPTGELSWLAVTFLCMTLAGQVLAIAATYLSEKIGWRACNELRSDLTEHCLRLPMDFHKDHAASEIIERLDGDVTALANFFSQFSILVLSNIVLLAGIVCAGYLRDWRIGIALAIYSSLMFVTYLRLRNGASPYWLRVRQVTGQFYGFLGERLAGLEDIRANGAEPYIMRTFYSLIRKRMGSELVATRSSALLQTASLTFFAAGMTLAFGVGGYLYTTGAVTLGTAYLLFQYAEQLRRPIQQISDQVQDLQQANASIERITALLDLQQEPQGDREQVLSAGPIAVTFTGITFGYVSDCPVLRGISFDLRQGEILGLLGRTGSGKTTITRLLARLYNADAGTIYLDGRDIRTFSVADLRRRIGLISQDVQLFAGTLRDNLTLFDRTISDREVLDGLRELGLLSWYESLPDGLDTQIASGTSGLSAGEAQLLAFARIYLKDPGLIILDEASSRLDPATEARIEGAVDKLLKGRTAIIVAHRLATVQRADTILILNDGLVEEYGSYAKLAEDSQSHLYRLLRVGLEEVLA